MHQEMSGGATAVAITSDHCPTHSPCCAHWSEDTRKGGEGGGRDCLCCRCLRRDTDWLYTIESVGIQSAHLRGTRGDTGGHRGTQANNQLTDRQTDR